jgi:hypothetical protein
VSRKETAVRRRFTSLVALVAALGLIAGCGGGSDDKQQGSGGGGTPSGDAASILNGITTADDGPAKVRFSLRLDLKGQIKEPQLALVLDGSPIVLDLSGPVGANGKTADLTFGLKAGKVNLKGGLRILEDKTGYVQLADKWYVLPEGTLNTGGEATQNLDAKKILEALGDPNALLKDPKVEGVDDIDGFASDHVSGDLDTKALLEAFARISTTIDPSASPIDPKQIDEALNEVGKYVKSTSVDIWVDQKEKVIRKFGLATLVELDGSAKDETGIEGADVQLEVSSTPTDEPDIEAPGDALPAEQLSQDITGILLSSFAQP